MNYREILLSSGDYTEFNQHILIICPFHDDHTPSCSVNKYIGYFKCFACGESGSWEKLAKAKNFNTDSGPAGLLYVKDLVKKNPIIRSWQDADPRFRDWVVIDNKKWETIKLKNFRKI